MSIDAIISELTRIANDVGDVAFKLPDDLDSSPYVMTQRLHMRRDRLDEIKYRLVALSVDLEEHKDRTA